MTTNLRRPLWLCAAAALLALVLCGEAPAQTSAYPWMTVAMPDGKFNATVEDMRVKVLGGYVRWTREYDGHQWRFSPHWSNLDLLFEIRMPVSGGGAGGGGGGGGGATTGDRPVIQETFGGTRTPGLMPADAYNDSMYGELLWIRRNGAWFGADSDYGSFALQNGSARYFVKPLQQYGEHKVLYPQTLRTFLPGTPVFRWTDRAGEWIDYDRDGAILAYGDKSNVTVTFEYEEVADGASTLRRIKRVKDHHGNPAIELIYDPARPALLREVRDVPDADDPRPARSVEYDYDAKGNLAKVTDVRGHDSLMGYDDKSRLTSYTDAEQHEHRIGYWGASSRVDKQINAEGGQTDYAYDHDKLKDEFLVAIKEPATEAGRRTEDRRYSGDGKLLRVDVNGRTEQQYAREDRITRETDARGVSTEFVRNEFDQVVATKYADGSSLGYVYDARNLALLESRDEEGFRTKYEYDDAGNLVKRTEAMGTPDERVTEFVVDALGLTRQITRKGRTEVDGTVTPDAVWRFDYDARGQPKQTIDPEGHVRTFAYDRAGALTRFTDPRENTARYETDAAGQVEKAIDPLGHERRYDYDKVGNLTAITDPRQKVTRMIYDAMNRRTVTKNPVDGERVLSFDARGLPSAVRDEDERTMRFEFDTFQRLKRQTDGLGHVTTFEYEQPDGQLSPGGAPAKASYPTFEAESRYDERGRAQARTIVNGTGADSERLTSTFAYDRRGLLIRKTDARDRTRSYRHDALGRQIELTDALNGKTRMAYDARGNLIRITDANGNATRYEYDRADRLVKETLPLGQATTYAYDDAGNLRQRIDALQRKTEYRHDDANRLVEMKQYDAQGTLVRSVVYEHDEADNLVAWSDTDHTRPVGQQTMSAVLSYDDANRKTGENVTYPTPSGEPYVMSYGWSHSPAGKKTRLRWPDGSAIGYAYSAHGELETVTIPGEGTISVNRFMWTAPEQITLPGGTTQSKTYDGVLSLTGLAVKSPAQQSTLELANRYGREFELLERSRSDTHAGVTTSVESTFGYDDELRLTSVQDNADVQTITLDAVANRIAHSRVEGAWTYDANNRLIRRGSATTYEYDDAGNLTKKTEGANITRYRYDATDRLVEVRDTTDQPLARYGYDALDRRAWKEQYADPAGVALAEPKRTYFLYADEGLIGEAVQGISTEGGEVTASGPVTIGTQYGPVPEAPFTTGHLFVKTPGSSGAPIVGWYHHDHLGTPVQATDKSGRVVWAASYDAFGKATITTPPATEDKPTIESRLRLPGQYFDEETGLHYNYYRYYEPRSGRYVQADPLGVATYRDLGAWRVGSRGWIGLQTVALRTLTVELPRANHAYTYADGDPVGATDPSGLQTIPKSPAEAAVSLLAGQLGLDPDSTVARLLLLPAVVDECVRRSTQRPPWGPPGGGWIGVCMSQYTKLPKSAQAGLAAATVGLGGSPAGVLGSCASAMNKIFPKPDVNPCDC